MSLLPEIQQIEKIISNNPKSIHSEILAYSEYESLRFPLHKVSFGSTDPKAPVLGFIGGVHGLERIGAQVCVALMSSLAELSRWDETTQNTLKNIRIFFIPTVNPIGIYRKTRSNPRGIDLMRNAPVEAENPAPYLGGHRLSPRLPWYRGALNEPMEIESQALIKTVESEIKNSPLAMTIDIHSGCGFQDQLWFPYAKTTKPFPDLAMAHSLKKLLDKTYPHHIYQFEPQAKSYTTHGDIWDYIYDNHRSQQQGRYLPLCLEMGSWMWVKKNPWQLFSSDGPFNPKIIHRYKRTLRRHNTLMDFLIRAISSQKEWVLQNDHELETLRKEALDIWYKS